MERGISRRIRRGAAGLGLIVAVAGSAGTALAATPETPPSIVIGGTLVTELTAVTDLLLGTGGVVIGGPNTLDFGNDGLLAFLLEDTLGLVGPDGLVTGLIGPQGLNVIGQAGDYGVVDGLVLGLLGNGGAVRELLFGAHGVTAALTGQGSLEVVAPVADLLTLLLGADGTVDTLVEGLLGTGLYGSDGLVTTLLPGLAPRAADVADALGLAGRNVLADPRAATAGGLLDRFALGDGVLGLGLFGGLQDRSRGAFLDGGGLLNALPGR